MAWLNQRTRGPLAASGVRGAADPAEWAAAEAAPLDWDELFASTGLFGVEIGAAAEARRGQAVEMRGFLSPPMVVADYFVLSRNPLPNCPFCNPAASWPDDIIVVHVRTPGVDIDDPARPIAVRGTLSLDHEAGPQPGLSSFARLTDALWATVA